MIFKSTPLLIASVSASTPTPGPATFDPSSPDFATPIAFAAAMTPMIDTANSNINVGGYGCLRSGLLWVPPQIISHDADATNGVASVVTGGTKHSVFYGTTKTELGGVATMGSGAAFPDANNTLFNTSDSPASWTNNSVWAQCCTNTDDSVDPVASADLAGTCSTVINHNTKTNGVLADSSPTVYFIAGRVALINGADGLYENTANADNVNIVTAGMNQDFIMNALGQLSDDTVASNNVNYCSGVYGEKNNDSNYFKTGSESAATLTVSEGFSGKTKCTWQIIGQSDNLAKISLTKADAVEFYLQWIEWSTAGSNQPTSIGNIPDITDFDAAAYDLGATASDARIWWLNPFIGQQKSVDNVNWGAATGFEGTNWFNSYPAANTYSDGSIGRIAFYANDADTGALANLSSWGSANTGDIDASVVLDQYAAAQTSFTAAAGEKTKFDGLLTTYNTAVKDYNTALDETPDEASLDDIPERPCPPSTPGNYYGIELVGTAIKSGGTAFDVAAGTGYDDFFDGTGGNVMAIRASLVPSATPVSAAWADSQRVGYANVYPDNGSAAYSANFSGHVFGQLGASFNDSSKGARWMTASTITAYQNFLQVAVLPVNSNFALASGKEITISAEPIGRDTFDAPSPTAVPKATYEEVTGASALIASTMALGTLAYTLF